MSDTPPDSTLCRQVLNEVAARISEHQYLTWFQRVRFSYAGPERIAVHVPNKFHLTFMKHRYLPVISEAVESVTNLPSPRLDFRIEESSESSRALLEEHQPAGAPVRPPQRPSPSPDSIPLNPAYVFEEFVTGPSNRLAHAAAVSVAQTPGTTYNPLFIFGSVGLGKTHLMQAVTHVLLEGGMRNIVYMSCASFTNDFIAAVGRNDLDRFRRQYREADALLIDDIQFLARKDRTQEEFFHTFNTIYNQQKQIFLSSDSQPSEIDGLGERLVSRFRLGLVAQLSPPKFETRVAILLRKGRSLGLDIPQEVGEYVAHRFRDNVREIEGALHRIHSMVEIEKRPLTIESVRDALSDLIPDGTGRVDLARIQQAAVKRCDVRSSDLFSKKRNRSIVLPRQICMYLARRHTNLSLGEIGKHFGGRDHTTVLHAVEKIGSLVENDSRIRSLVQSIESEL